MSDPRFVQTCREKYWHEKSDSEKIEKMADTLRYFCHEFIQLHKLMVHSHRENGDLVIPFRYEDELAYIFKNPLNEEKK
jgi:hypothetical protein